MRKCTQISEDASLLAVRAIRAGSNVLARLGCVVGYREPLQVRQLVPPVRAERLDVVDLEAGAGAPGVPVRRARMRALEFSPERPASLRA